MSRRKPLPQYVAEIPFDGPPPPYRLALVREPEAVPYTTAPSLCYPAAVAAWLGERLAVEPAEVVGMIALDCRHRPILYSVLYRGTINRSACEPAGILRAALLCNASAVLVFHNHPSGDPSPSAEDIAFTRRLAEAGEIVGIRLVDHVVIGSVGRFVSLRERGAW